MIVKSSASKAKVFEGVYRKVLAAGEKMMVVEFSFEKNACVPMHRHAHEQVGYVVEGRFKLTIDDEEYIIEKGDSYFIRSNAEHAALALEKSLAIDIFSPPREDYLAKK